MKINFIIPIRHPRMMVNVDSTRKYLYELLESVIAQDSENWSCFIVHNQEFEIEVQHPKIIDVKVDFEPMCDPYKEQGIKDYFNDIRLDKGNRVFVAAKQVPNDEYIMVIDDDDLLHKSLCSSLNDIDDVGIITKGYILDDATYVLRPVNDLDKRCGSTFAIRKELYSAFDIKNDSDPIDKIKELGSHVMPKEMAVNRKMKIIFPDKRLVAYRVNHANSSSTQLAQKKSLKGKFKLFLFGLFSRLKYCSRKKSQKILEEFFNVK